MTAVLAVSSYAAGETFVDADAYNASAYGQLFWEVTGNEDEIAGYEGEIGSTLYNLSSGGTSFCVKTDSYVWYEFDAPKNGTYTFACEYVARVGTDRDAQLIRFEWDNPNVAFGEIVDWAGQIPIPPYLNRKSEAIDDVRYQTIYSAEKGSVAAPTAGLHFTQAVFDSLKAKGIEHLNVTLHVGAGTFKPVQTETIGEHPMHIEHFVLSDEILKPLCDNKKKVVAVGTTTVRTLESMYWLGVKAKLGLENPLDLGQWEAYSLPDTVSVSDAFEALLDLLNQSGHQEITASTCIMIAPGYQYKVVDTLITNFHQPQSTLLLLVSALIGDNWHRVYDYALAHDFRFLSYGDSCLLKVN